MTDPPVTELGHYKLLRLLGQGGMGSVYLAVDRKLGRRVALKRLPTELERHPERRARFEREARAAAALNHPGIVTIFSIEEADAVPFLTMELVEGEPLSDVLTQDGLELARFLELAIQIAEAVSAAHEAGLTHRDLKPQNIMLTDEGRTKILDFGLAKTTAKTAESGFDDLATADHLTTGEGRVLGTVAYMSPEQANGQSVDSRSDIFSLGIVLFEMATGQRPFRGDSNLALMNAIFRDEPLSMSELKPELPDELVQVVNRCLHKQPKERLQTAQELGEALNALRQRLASGESVVTTATATSETVGKLPRLLTSWCAQQLHMRQPVPIAWRPAT